MVFIVDTIFKLFGWAIPLSSSVCYTTWDLTISYIIIHMQVILKQSISKDSLLFVDLLLFFVLHKTILPMLSILYTK